MFLGGPYIWMALCGLVACALLLDYHLKEEGFPIKTRVRLIAIAGISVLAGVCVANIGNWFFGNLLEMPLSARIARAGFTWYPGMLAAMGILALILWLTKADMPLVMHLAAPCYPLFHAFGRLGCAFSGCCYGIVIGAQGQRVPTQLIEAVFLIGLFLILEFVVKKNRISVYILAYAAGRFVIEFFRGDDRGSFFPGSPLSPAQWIAIFSAAAVGCVHAVRAIKNKYSPCRTNKEED
ncbi:prolipoprotein diacylglyceryl transferase [Christensenellaceae bacterium OttesenSCG-928-K19]|nr:prolipoprotein diacylglyceryl transferase [Christensenellaceae bacterium OttesenSCG-928-K19]